MQVDSSEIIVRCKACGTSNRIHPHAPNLRAVCAKCRTPLEEFATAVPQTFSREFSYHKYVKSVDVRKLIEVNTVFDEARGRNFPSNARCYFCGGSIHSDEAIRLSNGDYICEGCFREVQTIRYPEVYQTQYERYIVESEARRIALDELTSSLTSTKIINRLTPVATFAAMSATILTVLSIVVFFLAENKLTWFLVGVVVFLSAYGLTYVLNRILSYYRNSQRQAISEWSLENPEPTEPTLKHFHDPSTELSDHDRKVLQVFDYWPGYPPFWNYVRSTILDADMARCQVSGCPSRTELHVHHKVPMSKGGSHRIDNLVTLCVFHHALQPDMGHERIWGEVRTQYFSMVRAHYRNGAPVRAHVRRKELATEETLREIVSYYSLACPDCNHHPLQLEVDYRMNEILISCPSCFSEWKFQQKLPEESGPQIAQTLRVLRNMGRWSVDFSLMESIRKPSYRKTRPTSSAGHKPSMEKVFEENSPLLCPQCGRVLQEREGRFGKFLGCTGYPDCRYTRNLEKSYG